MGLTFFQKVTAALSGLLVLIILHLAMVNTVSHQIKAVILRAEFVLALETILTFLSVMIWRTFSPYLKASSHSHLSGTSSNSMNGTEFLHRRNSNENLEIQNELYPRSEKGWTILQWLLLAYLFLCQTSYLTNIVFISKEPHWFAMLAYICLGSYIQLVMGLLIANVLSFIVSWIPSSSRQTKQGLDKKVVVLIAILYSLLASTLGFYAVSQPPAVRHVKIPVRDLPLNLDGLSIVQISDIHLGPTVGFTKLNMIVDIVNRQQPDVVVMTGDLVDGKVNSLRSAAEPLSRVVSKYGNFFVSGNHEYYTGDVDNWFSYIRSLGFMVLHNSNVKIPAKVNKDQGQLCIAGVDDVQADIIGYAGHGFDVTAAVKGCSKSEPVILLAHQPRAAKRALDSDHRVDLVLSGHTHGGQIFPMIIGAYLLNPFYLGLYQYGPTGSHVYVNEGTQYWGTPMRIGTSTEITRITLVKAAL